MYIYIYIHIHIYIYTYIYIHIYIYISAPLTALKQVDSASEDEDATQSPALFKFYALAKFLLNAHATEVRFGFGFPRPSEEGTT